jgi:hypothetical protein
MMFRSLLILILFTGISSLASGQWEFDQFLFETPEAKTRRKPVKREDSKSTTEVRAVSDSNIDGDSTKPDQPAPSVGVEERSPRRNPAMLPKLPVSLSGSIGVINIAIDSSLLGGRTRGSLSTGGVTLGINWKEWGEFKFSYATTSHFEMFVANGPSSMKRLRWETMALEFGREWSLGDVPFWLGLQLRQNSWWGAINGRATTLEQASGVGVGALFHLARMGHWQPGIQIRALPVYFDEDQDLSGNSYGFDWVGRYQFSESRVISLQIGYEQLQLDDRRLRTEVLDQGMVQILFSYEVSTR